VRHNVALVKRMVKELEERQAQEYKEITGADENAV
jgi:hypothetical protein